MLSKYLYLLILDTDLFTFFRMVVLDFSTYVFSVDEADSLFLMIL